MNMQMHFVPGREMSISIVEEGRSDDPLHETLVIGRDIEFSTRDLESYATAKWSPVVYDAMIVAAAVEYCDRCLKRSSNCWARHFKVKVSVHEPERWMKPEVFDALHEALGFLTGDRWQFEFVPRSWNELAPRQAYLELPPETEAAIAFSDGLDSRAVAGLIGADLKHKLVRVRLGSKRVDRPRKGLPFAAIPYKLRMKTGAKEPSARNRGFRFALISGLASYICNAPRVVIPESGQGALGPVLVPVAHAYPDYRNHPSFLKRMARFMSALLESNVDYVFPRLWFTKGQTLHDYIALGGSSEELRTTRSCWKSAQWSSIEGSFRQCGVCAACMLRRMSMFTARQTESADTYITENLGASQIYRSIPASFDKLNKSFTDYAIAGVLHMDHLADLRKSEWGTTIRRQAMEIAVNQGVSLQEAELRINAMISQHADEWSAFVSSLGRRSFVRNWVRGGK